jgi:hypothetical protein
MALGDLTTYEIWFDDNGNSDEPVLLFKYQDQIGLTDEQVKTNSVARLQSMIDKIETPGVETVSVRVGVVYPPARSVRMQRHQDNTNGTV